MRDSEGFSSTLAQRLYLPVYLTSSQGLIHGAEQNK